MSHPSAIQAVSSLTRITGDRNALEKYLNPHLLAMAVLYSESLKVILVDTVTGNVIHSVHHLQVGGHVGIVQSENNIFYYYWNNKNLRVEISVMELFKNELDWQR